MQTGFAMLEAGLVSPKNTQNILLKNIMDASIGAIMFFFLGFGISNGAGAQVRNWKCLANGIVP